MSLLVIKNITKTYGKLVAVDNVSLEVKKGEVLGLLGPNGAGKSTTISMISTLLKPDQGDITYLGESIIKNPKAIQKKLGVVPQEIALYPTLTGRENLMFWGHAYGLRGSELKKRVQEVSEVIGISDRLKDKVEKYSGGMKRRINIGAALLHNPELLIMDEPTVGIDPQSRNHILETVKSLSEKGMTIIYTSHYMEEVEFLCNRIAIVDQGKIIARGTQKELVEIIGGTKKIHISFKELSEDIIQTLKAISYVKEIEALPEEHKLIMEIDKSDHFFQDIVNEVGKTQGNILSLEVEEPNLEAVFLHLTGKGLRD